MQAKKKICNFCNVPQFIWKREGKDRLFCRSCWGKEVSKKSNSTGVSRNKPTSKQQRTPIPPRSSKKIKLDAAYSTLREQYLKNHPQCEASIQGICSGKGATQIHHKIGKIGEDYLDDKHFLAVDFECHRYLEDNPEYAYSMGFSELRLTK